MNKLLLSSVGGQYYDPRTQSELFESNNITFWDYAIRKTRKRHTYCYSNVVSYHLKLPRFLVQIFYAAAQEKLKE